MPVLKQVGIETEATLTGHQENFEMGQLGIQGNLPQDGSSIRVFIFQNPPIVIDNTDIALISHFVCYILHQ